MAIRRTTVILVSILALVVVAGVVLFMMFPDQAREALGGKSSTNSTTNTATQNSNTTTAPTNLSTPQDLSGDTPLTATMKVGASTIVFSSLDRLNAFDQIPAPENQRFVVMYFEGLPAAETASVFEALAQAQLVDGDKRYSPDKLKIATNVVKNDRGYLVFIVPTDAGKLVLEVGSGTEVQRVELP